MCDLDPKDKVKGQIMYFLVKVSPQRLDVAKLLQTLLVHYKAILGKILCDRDRSKFKKMGICDGVSSTAV